MKLLVCSTAGETKKKTWLHSASPGRNFLSNIFQNSFSFFRKAASPAVSREAEVMPNGAYVDSCNENSLLGVQ